MKTILTLRLLTLLVITPVLAEEEEDPPSLSEIISNLAQQIPQKFFDYITSMSNK
jgi:hypothetical protein